MPTTQTTTSSPSAAFPLAKVVLDDKLAQIATPWTPHIIAELNGQHVKLAKLIGEFVWHHHPNEDELFLILSGRLRMELRDGVLELAPGELVVIPRGVEHRPVAEEEVSVLLFEPASTLNTGNIVNERTLVELARI